VSSGLPESKQNKQAKQVELAMGDTVILAEHDSNDSKITV
jgi:hypothetical protein